MQVTIERYNARGVKKTMCEGINRLKQHIAGIGVGREMSTCFLATYEKRRLYRENLEAAKMEVEKRRQRKTRGITFRRKRD